MSSTASLCRRSEARRCDDHHDAFVVHVAVLLRGAVVVHVYMLRWFCCSLVVDPHLWCPCCLCQYHCSVSDTCPIARSVG